MSCASLKTGTTIDTTHSERCGPGDRAHDRSACRQAKLASPQGCRQHAAQCLNALRPRTQPPHCRACVRSRAQASSCGARSRTRRVRNPTDSRSRFNVSRVKYQRLAGCHSCQLRPISRAWLPSSSGTLRSSGAPGTRCFANFRERKARVGHAHQRIGNDRRLTNLAPVGGSEIFFADDDADRQAALPQAVRSNCPAAAQREGCGPLMAAASIAAKRPA